MKQDQTEQHLSIAEIIKLEKRFRAFGLQKWCGCDFAHDNGQNPDATDKMYRYADNFEELLEDGIGKGLQLFLHQHEYRCDRTEHHGV